MTTSIGPGIRALPGPLQTSVYRIVQESLNNARQHSGAVQVHIDLRCDGNTLHRTIRADGRRRFFR